MLGIELNGNGLSRVLPQGPSTTSWAYDRPNNNSSEAPVWMLFDSKNVAGLPLGKRIHGGLIDKHEPRPLTFLKLNPLS